MGNDKRTYRVLIEDDHTGENMGTMFSLVGDFEAGDPRGAIRLAVDANGVGPKYVAVALSGWHEETPKPAPRPALRWS